MLVRLIHQLCCNCSRQNVVTSMEADPDWARVGSLEFNQKYENHKGSSVRELATLRVRLHLAGVDREKLLAQQRELESERRANGLSVGQLFKMVQGVEKALGDEHDTVCDVTQGLFVEQRKVAALEDKVDVLEGGLAEERHKMDMLEGRLAEERHKVCMLEGQVGMLERGLAEERGHTMQLRELLEAALRRVDGLERLQCFWEFTFRGLRDGNGLFEWLGT